MKKFIITLTVLVAFIAIFLMMGPLYIIDEGSQVVVTRLGKIINSHTEAGLYFKMPFVDKVTTYPKRILSLDGDTQPMPTKENQYIIVDTTARWRINDPKLFYQSFKDLNTAYNRLSDIIDSATRMIIAKNNLAEVVRSSNIISQTEVVEPTLNEAEIEVETIQTSTSQAEDVKKGRRQLSLEMADEARKMLVNFGIDLIDIVPRQIKYADEMTESVYNRMIKERNQMAQYYRSLGEGEKAKMLGRLENEKRAILSEAYRVAEEKKGAADAEASRIYAEAYQQDADFYAFWKSLESYKETMPNFDAIYSTDMQYFKYLYSTNGR